MFIHVSFVGFAMPCHAQICTRRTFHRLFRVKSLIDADHAVQNVHGRAFQHVWMPGTPGFQHAIVKLKRKADLEQACDGYYHLSGRAELALTVQRRILPSFGFPGSRAGVLEMVLHCTKFLEDRDNDEIAKLWDDINSKLGMTQEACRRFRESATGFKGSDGPREAVDTVVDCLEGMEGSMCIK